MGSRIFGATISTQTFLVPPILFAGPFQHRSFRRQFGALSQFSYLGLGFELGLVIKPRIGAEKVRSEMVAPRSRGPSLTDYEI